MRAKFRYESARRLSDQDRETFTDRNKKGKQLTHDEVNDAVEAFVAAGGAVEQIPTGYSGREADAPFDSGCRIVMILSDE